jgi:hypothetical protein
MESDKRYEYANNGLRGHIAHFPIVSNANVMTAVLLQYLDVKCVFYADDTINEGDIIQNAYYEADDDGKLVSYVLNGRMSLSNIQFVSDAFEKDKVEDGSSVIVNSDSSNWIDSDKCIVLNTWNYENSCFEDFTLLNGAMDIPNDLKQLIEGYVIAIRTVDDMAYCLKDGVVF